MTTAGTAPQKAIPAARESGVTSAGESGGAAR